MGKFKKRWHWKVLSRALGGGKFHRVGNWLTYWRFFWSQRGQCVRVLLVATLPAGYDMKIRCKDADSRYYIM